MEMLSRSNTQALKGIAAIGIFVFHILLGYDITPFFNMWGGLFVAVFLILSGYGIEESFRKNGLKDYWKKRMKKVILPFVFFVCAYNYMFSFLFGKEQMHRFLDELLYISPTFWFVFFILICYVVYWVGTRFLKGWWRFIFFGLCAFACLHWQSPSGHLEAEQSFCFLAGILLSVNKNRLETLSDKTIKRWMFLLLLIGLFFYCLKAIPQLHELKGSIAYNYFLCPFRLTTGLAFIPLLTMLRPSRSSLLETAGKYSLEIYIAHIPFIGLIFDAKTTIVFLACSVGSFILLMIYRNYIEKKVGIAAALYIIINVLFVAKYSTRISEKYAFFAILAAIVFYYALMRIAIPLCLLKEKRKEKLSKMIVIAICFIAVLLMIIAQFVIDPYSIQVDRWSALHFPIQNLLSGIYPYSANTHLGGYASPFPIWQVFHIPFYLMGNVGLSFFAAVALFLWSCWKVHGLKKTLIISLLLCTSIAIWYEVLVRSDLITNFLLLASFIQMIFCHINQEWVEKKCWWIACAIGLMLSTRLLIFIPVGILFLPYFIKMNFGRQVGVILLMLIIFALTFLPFALWDWQKFYYFQNNPWSLQTKQGNTIDFIFFLPIAIYLAMTHKKIAKSYYRNAALMLIIFVGITFIHNMYLGENWDLFSSSFDITYLSTAIPFCLLSIIENADNSKNTLL